MCAKKKCLDNKEKGSGGGGGGSCYSFYTLHRQIIGFSRADSVTSFCDFHTKEQKSDMMTDFQDVILDTQRNP